MGIGFLQHAKREGTLKQVQKVRQQARTVVDGVSVLEAELNALLRCVCQDSTKGGRAVGEFGVALLQKSAP